MGRRRCCCSDNDCVECSGASPTQVQVDISGFTDATLDCPAFCEDIDGTYVCDQNNTIFCQWEYYADPAPEFGTDCGLYSIIVDLAASELTVTITIYEFEGATEHVATLVYTTSSHDADCTAWSAESCSWDPPTVANYSASCTDESSVTVEVTAL